jgi:hypothetical protein
LHTKIVFGRKMDPITPKDGDSHRKGGEAKKEE